MLKPEFIEMLKAMADSRFDNLPAVIESTAPEVSVRLNPRKLSGETVENSPTLLSELQSGEAGLEPVTWWPEYGRYLIDRPKFTFDPALHQGRYYVQDASSMILAPVARELARRLGGTQPVDASQPLSASQPLLWLDACAAPGGKTTAVIDALPEGSLVVANEFDYQRAEILKENLAKWGYPGVVVTRGDTARYRKQKELFDVVAIDAPCSGEGMMRKDAVAREQWSPALVEECAERQREIIENLWGTLRPGGFLVYSTCTFNTSENEEIVRWIVETFEAETVDLGLPFEIDGEVKASSDVENPLPVLRFIPGRIRGEGLFLSVLRKPGDWQPALESLSGKKDAKKGKGSKSRGNAKPSVAEATVKGWISPDSVPEYSLKESDGEISAFPTAWLPILNHLEKSLDIIAQGVQLAELKGKDVIPTQPLALSTILNPEAFPRVELQRNEALLYLSRESISLPDSAPKGFILLIYNGLPLGFVKNLGNRSNNLYPKEWRIKSKIS